MPIARFQMPDGKVARFEVPEGTTPDQANAMMQAHFAVKALPADGSLPVAASPAPVEHDQLPKIATPYDPRSAPAPKSEPMLYDGKTIGSNLAGLSVGSGIGAAGLGDTILKAASFPASLVTDAARAILPDGAKRFIPDVSQWNRTRDADMTAINEQVKGNLPVQAGKLIAEVAGTWPVGGLLGKGAGLVASLPKLAASAPKIAPLISAIETGGFRTGTNLTGASRAAKLADLGTRAAGGAITGAASTALVAPDHIGTGALVGGALPPALKAAGALSTLPGKAIRKAFEPQSAGATRAILDAAEATTPEAIAALRSGLTQQGPSMIPGSIATVPQILQQPAVAQLQRTIENVGAKAIPAREAANNTARIAALDTISPVTGTVQQAAENMGNMTQKYAKSAEKDATERVSRLYDAVDPNNESAFYLPIEDMQAARDKFLGRGTFGSGAQADAAISTAKSIGTDTVEATKPLSTKGMQDLVLAVRAAGGINTTSKSGQLMAGEIRNLRESGLNNIVRPNKGLSVDRMAEQMHESGFLPDNDPATLLDLLHQSAQGSKVYASSAEDAYRHAMEASMGPPPAAGTFAKTVPFNEVQNLRSSIGEAATAASEKGRLRENAALVDMLGKIDSGVNKVGGGGGLEGEHFPLDMSQRWRDANKGHEIKMRQFHTGPQASMFRSGADGMPSAQGAELASKFFNASRGQAEDAQAFNRLIGDNQHLRDAVKNYAITDLAGQTNKFGHLNNLKFNGWLDGRSGAVRETFAPHERSLMGQIGAEVKATDLGATTGMARGSNTLQNAANVLQLGLLDSQAVKAMAHHVPIAKYATGPALEWLRETAKRGKAAQLDGLLADPLKLDAEIARYLRGNQQGKLPMRIRGLLDAAAPAAYHSAPLLGSGQ